VTNLFDFDKPARYAVMGNPVQHSKSPRIHSLFAQQTGQNIEYSAIQVDPGGLEQAIGNFQASGGKGLNITVPFKQEAWKLMDQLSDRARLAGAVNTILFRGEERFGDNTDGVGLIRDLCDNHGITLQNRHILLLGAGGAARGVIGPLLELQPARLVIANRTPHRAEELARDFSQYGEVRGRGFPALGGEQFHLIINATAASLAGELPPLPDRLLLDGGSCYDMMYAPEPTPFLRWAERHGAGKTMDGLGMLVEQAAESFHLWRGVRPETAPVITAIRREMTSTDNRETIR